MSREFLAHLAGELAAIERDGLRKQERLLSTAQDATIRVGSGPELLNFCANNYLGLANHPALLDAAREGLERFGFGMASVRFICGTQTRHRELEERLSAFLGTEDTILYSSCFDANGGLFEALLGEQDAVISDALNHASIIDGIRLCKARRYRYASNDLDELERQLRQADADGARFKLIATDGVFSMDGIIARLDAICALADRYRAQVMVDDSHAVGVIGARGRGTHEHCGVIERVDIITGTLGKALGGASGGYTSGRREIIELLRQRSRPYLFSNSLAPPIVNASIRVLDMLEQGGELRERLRANSTLFRGSMAAAGFRLGGAGHPIVPVMIGDARLAATMAEQLLGKGIYVVGFSFPVVPEGAARIRAQLSAAHTPGQIERAVAAFAGVGKSLGVI
ncbi:MAG: glycine C-acetyltransferase [Gammaproteobacteria bacterium]|nr:glycine C-acetyltransferase [Gammaproteobacteria bacterium]